MAKPLGYFKIQLHQKNSMSKRFTTCTKDLNSQTIFIPGCSLASYDAFFIDGIMNDLKRYDAKVQLYVNCCAKPLLEIGDMSAYRKQHADLERLFIKKGVREIIVACSNCYKVFKEAYSKIKVLTLWEVISKLGVRPIMLGHYKDSFEYAIHDPCQTNTYLYTQNHVRKIISELGIRTVEFDVRGKCCGSKDMKSALRPKRWREIAMNRIRESPSERILSYCQSCVQTFSANGGSTLHLLDFLYNPKVIDHEADKQRPISTLKAWQNRFQISR